MAKFLYSKDVIHYIERNLNMKFIHVNKYHVSYLVMDINNNGINRKYIILVNDFSKKCKCQDFPIKAYFIDLHNYENYEDIINELVSKDTEIMNDTLVEGKITMNSNIIERMYEFYDKYGCIWERHINKFINELDKFSRNSDEFINKSQPVLKESKTERHLFDYTKNITPKCRAIVISSRASSFMLKEAKLNLPLETGVILAGHYNNGVWYVVETIDCGLNGVVHTKYHHESDSEYQEHLLSKLSLIYDNNLELLGLEHNHPESFDRFSHDDNMTNKDFAEYIGNGTISLLMNFDPNPRITAYYLDYEDTGQYYNIPVFFGDKYFKGTNYLDIKPVNIIDSYSIERRKCRV